MTGNTAHFKFFSVPLIKQLGTGFLKFKTRPGRCDMVIITSPLKGLIPSPKRHRHNWAKNICGWDRGINHDC